MRDQPSRPRAPRGRVRPAASTSAARPAPRRAGASGPGTTTRTSAPRPGGRITGRATVLSVVLVALALSYVFPLRIYLSQQAEIAQLRERQAVQKATVERLAEEATRWQDEDYIRIQARKRLYYGEPGELLLLPVWDDDPPPPATGFDPDDAPPPATPWWDTLWTSVRLADGTAGDPAAPDEAATTDEAAR